MRATKSYVFQLKNIFAGVLNHFLLVMLGVLFSLCLPLLAGEAEDLGGYRKSFKIEVPQTGWGYLWNAESKIGDSAGYKPLNWNGRFYITSDKFPTNDNLSNYLCLGNRSGHPGVGSNVASDKRDHFAIAAYTMQKDASGHIWLTDGNILRGKGGGEDAAVELLVYVGDELKSSEIVKGSEEPVVFQCDLGALKKGDTIYVAVGPNGADSNDSFHIDYQLMDYPEGSSPAEATNTILKSPSKPDLKTKENGQPDDYFLRLHNEYLAQAPEADPRVVFLGDSITFAWMRTGKKIWEERIVKYKPFSLGISGDRTEHVLWRIANGELDKIHPEIIVLMIGTNNIHMHSPEQISDADAAIIRAIQKKLPETTIILQGIFPRDQKPGTPTREKIKNVNVLLEKLADGNKVRFIDFGDKYLEPDGTISKSTMPDFLHPQENGYVIWADEITPLFDEILAKK